MLKKADSNLKTKMTKSPYLWLWFLAMVPRLTLAIVFFDQPIALDDMYQYDMLARSLLAGEGYRWYSQEDLEPLKPYYAKFIDMDSLQVPETDCKPRFGRRDTPFSSARFTRFPHTRAALDGLEWSRHCSLLP